MSISVRGIGWIREGEYGCVRTGLRNVYSGFPNKELFSSPVKNFGRFDAVSRMTCCAVALALKDSGIAYSSSSKQDIGIIGTNHDGSLRSDIEYFNDYLQGGRTLSRGNLFIYTLPSSPLGETAIHFGLLGPMLYIGGEGNLLLRLLDTAAEAILAKEAPIMLAGTADENEGAYFVLDSNPAADADILCDLSEAQSLVNRGLDMSGSIREFAMLASGKA